MHGASEAEKEVNRVYKCATTGTPRVSACAPPLELEAEDHNSVKP